MPQAFILFLILLASTLIPPSITPNLATGARLTVSGVGVALVLASIQIGEASYLHRVIRPWLVASCTIVFYLCIQLMPGAPMAHSVWASAAAALGSPMLGSVTVDVGATVMALVHLLALVSTTVLAASVMIDRGRAEFGLASLALAAVVIVAISWIKQPGAGDAVDCAIFGTLLASACGYLAFERYETRYAKQPLASKRLGVLCSGAGGATLFCVVTVVSRGTTAEIAIAGIAFAILWGIIVARRVGIGSWTGLALLLLACIAVILAAVNAEQPEWPLLAFTNARPRLVELTHRMIQDAPWLGTGAGTVDLLSGIYRGYDDPVNYQPPSLAAVLITELGWPASALLLLSGVFAAGSLLLKGFKRGRDSVYAILGTAVLSASLLLAFVNSEMHDEAVAILLAGVYGLALAQSESRRS